MSVDEVNRLFEAIKVQYERDGMIDPQQKSALLEEMKKLKGGEKFVQEINETLQRMDDGDDIEDSDNGDDSEASGSSDISEDRSDEIVKKDATDRCQIECSQQQSVQQNVYREVRAPRPLRSRIDVALKVFNLFNFTCNLEKTPIGEVREFSTTTATVSTEAVVSATQDENRSERR